MGSTDPCVVLHHGGNTKVEALRGSRVPATARQQNILRVHIAMIDALFVSRADAGGAIRVECFASGAGFSIWRLKVEPVSPRTQLLSSPERPDRKASEC